MTTDTIHQLSVCNATLGIGCPDSKLINKEFCIQRLIEIRQFSDGSIQVIRYFMPPRVGLFQNHVCPTVGIRNKRYLET